MERSLFCIIAWFSLVIFHVSDFWVSPLCSLWEQDSSLCAVSLAVGTWSWRCSSWNAFLSCRREGCGHWWPGCPGASAETSSTHHSWTLGHWLKASGRLWAETVSQWSPSLSHPSCFLLFLSSKSKSVLHHSDSSSESNFHLGTEFVILVSTFLLQAEAQHRKDVLIS